MKPPSLSSALACVLISVLPAQASEYFASPEGTNQVCTATNPCSLGLVLDSSKSPARPGDTIWVTGGVYRGAFTSTLRGRKESPIVVRSVRGERAVIDGGDSEGRQVLTIGGAWTWYWDLEVMSSDPRRESSVEGSWPSDLGRGEGVLLDQCPGCGVGVKLINLIIHDTLQGISSWMDAVDSEIYGCIIYNNGWNAPDRSHGHGLYAQNRDGVKLIRDNIIFNNYSHGLHVYGSSKANLQGFQVERNAIFNNGVPGKSGPERDVLIGGDTPARYVVLSDNDLYYSPSASGTALAIGYSEPAEDVAIVNNRCISPHTAVDYWASGNSLAYNNLFAGSVGQRSFVSSETNSFVDDQPKTLEVYYRPNEYDRDLSYVVVYNGQGNEVLDLDLARVLRPGDGYEIVDAQDPLGDPIVQGEFDGAKVGVSLDEASKVAQPIGGRGNEVSHTPRAFNVFLIRRVASPGDQAARPKEVPAPVDPEVPPADGTAGAAVILATTAGITAVARKLRGTR